MPEQNLNPDALEAAASVLCDETAGQHTRYADLKTGLAKKLWGQRAEHVVSAYLAVAQQEVNSVEELDKLPVGSIIKSVHLGIVRERLETGWLAVGGDMIKSSRNLCELGASFTVLYRPVEG